MRGYAIATGTVIVTRPQTFGRLGCERRMGGCSTCSSCSSGRAGSSRARARARAAGFRRGAHTSRGETVNVEPKSSRRLHKKPRRGGETVCGGVGGCALFAFFALSSFVVPANARKGRTAGTIKKKTIQRQLSPSPYVHSCSPPLMLAAGRPRQLKSSSTDAQSTRYRRGRRRRRRRQKREREACRRQKKVLPARVRYLASN